MSTFSKICVFFLICALGVALSSCTPPSTPETRAAENPAVYNALPAKQKELIAKGEIDKGMSKGAVYIAWGNADRKADSFKDNKRTTRWDYTQLVPVYSNSYRGSFGWGSGYGYGYRSRYHRRGYYGYGDRIGFGTSIHYRPQVAASVVFENEKVTAWQIER